VRGRQRRTPGGADRGFLDRGPAGSDRARHSSPSTRGATKREARRPKLSGCRQTPHDSGCLPGIRSPTGAPPPRKRMRSPRASDDSVKCTCLASRLQKSKRSIFPGPCGGEAVAEGASSRRTTSPRERGVARNGSSCPSDGGERSGAGKRVPEHPGCASEQHAVGGHQGREALGRFDGRRFGTCRRHALNRRGARATLAVW